MAVVSSPQPTIALRSLGSWERRNIAELPQMNFRTTLRGFDRDEVRAILDNVAADYRVLQLQNASLQRQLASLEAVLQAYYREDSPVNGTAALRVKQQSDTVLQRATEEARAIIARAQQQAERMMAVVEPVVATASQPATVATPDAPSPIFAVSSSPARAVAPIPISSAPSDQPSENRTFTAKPSRSATARATQPIEVLLRSIDKALVAIPALPCE